MKEPAILITGGVRFVKKDDYDALQARLTRLEAAVRQVVESGKFDDLEPDDGLHNNSARRFLRHALAEPQVEEDAK